MDRAARSSRASDTAPHHRRAPARATAAPRPSRYTRYRGSSALRPVTRHCDPCEGKAKLSGPSALLHRRAIVGRQRLAFAAALVGEADLLAPLLVLLARLASALLV